MIITCKCGKDLTTDLYLTKNSYSDEPADEDFRYGNINIFPGSFLKENNHYYKRKERKQFWVNPINVLILLPEFKSGWGCCNHWGTELGCVCGDRVADIHLDCHEDKRIQFYESYIERRYK